MASSSTRGSVIDEDTVCNASPSKAIKVSGGLKVAVSSASSGMRDAIWEQLGENIELMAIVQETIKDYQKTRGQALAAHTIVLDVVVALKDARKRNNKEDDDENPKDETARKEERADFEASCVGEFRRGQLIFGQWNAKHVNECIKFMGAEIGTSVLLKTSLEQRKHRYGHRDAFAWR